ncbi:Transcriptional regulator HosA [Pseudoprimorskyibacter insulae]|uniref:Transcriptional regulator HosA n=2 Tax=Pseudoprimorskyibacter insulae TaxID=1695997 RepID=A0A2R8APU6_9RHOB|nr:Transcriptional regulator HosA [Pseudoprimorskyibacter insulae]
MAGHLVRRLHQISVAVFADRMTALGIDLTPVQFAVLHAVLSNPGIDQASVAGLVAYDKATLGGVVDRLENKGLLRREVSPKDRRARCLFLTDTGRALFENVVPEVKALQSDILSGLDAAETKQLLALLRKTTDAGNHQSRAPLKPLPEPDAD